MPKASNQRAKIDKMRLAEVLARLEGVRCEHGYYVAKCPCHDDRRASLSIREENGRLLLHCFAGCRFEAIIEALDVKRWHRPAGISGNYRKPRLDDAKRIEIARRIWRDTKPATGTIVETYLRSRGITIPVPRALRFKEVMRHPSGVVAPAMAAAVQKLDGRLIGIHRTWLRSDGSGKAAVEPPKASLGPIRGAAIRLAPATERLVLAEGIETALSVAQACPALAVWCAISASNLAAVQLPEIAREVIIAADGDEPGRAAADEAARGFLSQGRRVRIAVPPAGTGDFNDVLKGG